MFQAPTIFSASVSPDVSNSILVVMETSIQIIAAISFFVIGLSHIFQPRVWAEFFIAIRDKGEAGSFINAFIHFPLGVLIVGFHNVWHGIPMILTVIGWGLVLKSSIYFIYPAHALRMLAGVSVERSWWFVVAGVLSVALGSLLTFSIFSR